MLKISAEEYDKLQARNKGAWGLAIDQASGVKPAPIPKPSREAKPEKYFNHKATDDEGITHDSRKEMRRWKALLAMLRAGELLWLARQVRFALPGNTTYIADFVYQPKVSDMVVEDVKSEVTRKTQAYRIKVRQMKAIQGITVTEV